jgi:exonuclease III
MFGTQPIVSRLERCDVIDKEEAWALSDHCPIVIDVAD